MAHYFNETKQNKLRNIFEERPHWVIRYGISLLFSIIAIFLIASIYIVYPAYTHNNCVLRTYDKSTSKYIVSFNSDNYAEVIKDRKINIYIKDTTGNITASLKAYPDSSMIIQKKTTSAIRVTVYENIPHSNGNEIHAIVRLPGEMASLFDRIFQGKIKYNLKKTTSD